MSAMPVNKRDSMLTQLPYQGRWIYLILVKLPAVLPELPISCSRKRRLQSPHVQFYLRALTF